MVCYWTYSVKYLIFVEDKLHLGIATQTSLMSLLSICGIFVEDKLRLHGSSKLVSVFGLQYIGFGAYV